MKQTFEIEEGLLKYVEEITDVDYHGELELKDIENMIKDMITKYHRKEEELEDLQQDLRDNYVPRKIDPYWEYGVSRSDFI